MVHNHDIEFSTKFGNRTVFDIIAANTDPRNVVFQLDLYWVTFGGADPVAVLKRYGKRIQLFHVKDMRGSDRRIEIVGRGVINFPKIFAAGKNIRYYVVEHDPPSSPARRTTRSTRSRRPRWASTTSTTSSSSPTRATVTGTTRATATARQGPRARPRQARRLERDDPGARGREGRVRERPGLEPVERLDLGQQRARRGPAAGRGRG